jgi:hypothetical protein
MSTELPICSICQRWFTGYSCNAWPVNEGRCCQECDDDIVIPARMMMMYRNRIKEERKKQEQKNG